MLRTLEFAEVTIAKGGQKRLSTLSVTLRAGEVVGVTGSSGAGKTTFLDTVALLSTPATGTIRLNEMSLDEHLAHLWRDRISYVTQDGFLINDSVRSNLVWGAADLTDQALWDALAIVRMDAVIAANDEGLKMRVSERGTRFSGGERQRIALARAILRRPELLILDEATNAIDVETEMAIFENLMRIKPALTIIVVAHRASTLAMCNRIIRLEEGQLVADTTRSVSKMAVI